jgi:ferredoxin-NADP reductase
MTGDKPPAAAYAAPLAWQTATITRIERQTPRILSFFFRVTLAAHEAGQHVDVRLTADDGYQAQRSYSIASAPGAPELELAIERLDDGEVSPYFHDVAQPGDTVELRGPIGGHFVWRAEDGGPLLLIGGGSGIVPLAAIARHRDQVAPDVPTLLVASARQWADLLYRDELLAMSDRMPGFSMCVTTTREPRRRPGDYDRRLDAMLLSAILARWQRVPRHVYVCGSTPFVETVATLLTHAHVPPMRIRTERYGG